MKSAVISRSTETVSSQKEIILSTHNVCKAPTIMFVISFNASDYLKALIIFMLDK